MKCFMILFFGFLITCNSLAQTSKAWTLDDCIKYAEEHNIDVKKQSLSIEKSELELQDGKWAFVPSLSASSSSTVSTGRVLDPTTYQFEQTRFTSNSSSSLEGSIVLFEGGKKLYSLNRVKQSLRAAMLKDESVRNDLRINIAAAYLDLLCAREQVATARKSTELISEQLVRSQNLLDAGSITESDVLQLHSQLFAAENDVTSAIHSEKMARLTLCDLLEIDEYDSFTVKEPLFQEDAVFITDIENTIENQPDYQLAIINQNLAKTDYKIAKSSLYPTLSLSAGYGSSWSDARNRTIQNPDGTFRYEAYPFMAQYSDNASAYLSFGLRIPILTRLSSKNSSKRAQVTVREAELATAETYKQLRKKIIQAQIDCESAYDKYLKAQTEVRYAEEAYRQITEKYNLGTTDYLNWNTALVETAKANYALIESRYAYVLKVEILKLYMH